MSRKNCWVPEMVFVTVFCPFTRTGILKTGVQTVGGVRVAVACKVNPEALVGHIRTTLGPDGNIVSRGRPAVSEDSRNNVPRPELPPPAAVPYNVLAAITNPAYGMTPSLLPLKL